MTTQQVGRTRDGHGAPATGEGAEGERQAAKRRRLVAVGLLIVLALWAMARMLGPRAGEGGRATIAAGASHSLGLLRDGTVMAWGWNHRGRLGDGTTLVHYAPVAVLGLEGVVSIAAGGRHSLALLRDGTVMAWGENRYGQLGDGTGRDQPSPVQVEGLGDVTAIAAGAHHSLALKRDGTVMAWGRDREDQLGIASGYTTSLVPVRVEALERVAAIATSAGSWHSLALLHDGTVMAWGWDQHGQLGIVSRDHRIRTPQRVSGLEDVRAIAAGGTHSLALLKDGTVASWGGGHEDTRGWDRNRDRTSAEDRDWLRTHSYRRVGGLANVVAIAAGEEYSLALTRDGSVMAWGRNERGELGDGTTTSRGTPAAIEGLASVSVIAAGSGGSRGSHSFALLRDGTLMGWGDNADGQVGDGTNTIRTRPVRLEIGKIGGQ